MQEETITVILEVPKGKHYRSTSLTYNGEFTQLTECTDCRAIQDYWSNNSGICEYCGGQLIKNGTGKWDKNRQQWLRRQ